jgi:membrane protein DedA with SNARE-associated domain/rhodanese-related sulfurtransferase
MNPVELLSQFGLPLVFLFVLLEQGGLPLPAAPVLVCAGALAERGAMRPEVVLLAALGACMLADNAWYFAGRRYGRRLLSHLCRVSLSPDSCTRSTDRLLLGHGPEVLILAKFIPAISAVMVPTIAASGLSWRRFLMLDLASCLLYCGAYIAAGVIFSDELEGILRVMAWIGGWGFLLLGGLLGLYLAFRLLRRWRLHRLYRVVRILPDELMSLLLAEPDLTLVDARSALARAQESTMPGVLVLGDRTLADLLVDQPFDRSVVTFCSCPNEASAALLARQLIDAGYKRVRVLAGGEAAINRLRAALQPQMAVEDTGEPDLHLPGASAPILA